MPHLMKFAPENQNLLFKTSWCLDLLKYAEFDKNVHLSCFQRETPLFGKVGPKNQNFLFKMKVVI